MRDERGTEDVIRIQNFRKKGKKGYFGIDQKHGELYSHMDLPFYQAQIPF